MRTIVYSVSIAVVLMACSTEEATFETISLPAPVVEKKVEAPVAPVEKVAQEVWTLPADANPAMTDPTKATATAPAQYKVRFETTKGSFVVQVTREWSPNGADRLFNLVEMDYFTDVAFFRVINGFMAQFGISGYPEVNKVWHEAGIMDDPIKGKEGGEKAQSNKIGMVSFATAGPNTRTTQLFINFKDNGNLDGMGFTPVGEVVSGMDIVDGLYKGYGEGAPKGRGPRQDLLQKQGNVYLKAEFPKMDYIVNAKVVKD